MGFGQAGQANQGAAGNSTNMKMQPQQNQMGGNSMKGQSYGQNGQGNLKQSQSPWGSLQAPLGSGQVTSNPYMNGRPEYGNLGGGVLGLSQGFQGMGQGFAGAMGPQNPWSSMSNPAGQSGGTGSAPTNQAPTGGQIARTGNMHLF
jgi:hypothetical protein